MEAVFSQTTTKPLEALTTDFKPFNIRELDLQVWDSRDADNFRLLHQYENQGIINMADLDRHIQENGNLFGLRDWLEQPEGAGAAVQIKLDVDV